MQRLLPDRRFCDVSSGPTASQPASQPAARGSSFLDVETVWNELTSVIPRIEMIARFTSRLHDRVVHSASVRCNTEKNIRGAFQAEPVRLPAARGSCIEDNIRKECDCLIKTCVYTRERYCPHSSNTNHYSASHYHYHHSGPISLDCGCGQKLCTEYATSER